MLPPCTPSWDFQNSRTRQSRGLAFELFELVELGASLNTAFLPGGEPGCVLLNTPWPAACLSP